MLIGNDTYLDPRDCGTFLCWRFTTKNGQTRKAEEKLTNETLNKSKLVFQGKKEPVMAIRVKSQDGYKTVDLLPASLPLDQTLLIETMEEKAEKILITLKSPHKQWQILIQPSDPFCKYLWLLETDIQIQVQLVKGKDRFHLKLLGSEVPKSLSGTLGKFTATKFGYEAWMESSLGGKNISVPCSLAKQVCWSNCIDSFLNPESTTLSATISWSEKYKQYQVSHIEPLLKPGIHRFEFMSYSTNSGRQFLKLVSDCQELAGIQFSAFYPQFAPHIESFQRSSTHPIFLNVDILEDGDNLQLNLMNFDVPPELSLTGKISAVSSEGALEQAQSMYQIEVLGLGGVKLTMLSKLKVPADIELTSAASQHEVPIKFSPDKLSLLIGLSRNEGTEIKGTFYSIGFSKDLPDYALFTQKVQANTFAFRIHMSELHRFGIARIQKRIQIELTLISHKPPSGKGLEWKIAEIHNMENLVSGLKLAETITSKSTHVIRNWSAMQPSPSVELCDLSSFYYHGGALAAVSVDSAVYFLLPLSASLLSKKGIFHLKEDEELSTSFQISLDRKARKYVLACSDLDENRISSNQTQYSELKYIGQHKEKENTLIFKVTKSESSGPAVNSEISYTLREKEKIPFKSILNQKEVRFTVVTKQFRGKNYIAQFSRVDIGR